MKRFFLIPLAAVLLTCFSFSSCTKEARQQLFGSLLEYLLHNATANNDSASYLSGIWVDTDGTYADTFWIYTDSTILEHIVSPKDTLDMQLSGGYLYYPSYKQVLVMWNSAYDYDSKRNFPFSEKHIYNVKVLNIPPIMIKDSIGTPAIHTMSLDDLDTETGELMSSSSYTYVGPIPDDK